MTIGPTMPLDELAFLVGTALDGAGISAVLSGGGAATVWAPEANRSRDLDFVLTFRSAGGASARCLTDLGFRAERGGYVHPGTIFTLEFPPGPLMIGEEVVTEWRTLRRDGMVLQILDPTDCVRDRLAWFLLYDRVDYNALGQAVAVAARHEVDFGRIEAWVSALGAIETRVIERYTIFEARCASVRSDGA